MADIRRLARLARVREVERRRAAELAAASGGEHDRLRALARRSSELTADYAARRDPLDGAALAALLGFRCELASLSTRASSDADAARQLADRARHALATAQRRRDLVGEQLEARQREAEQRDDARQILAQSLNSAGRTPPLRRN
jgi:ABC-type transporter Mla subunit MlaD